jgi:putative transposase
MKRFTHKPPRWKEDNAVYFLTFCTFHRRKLLHQKNIPDILVDDLRFYSKKVKEVIAYTIMPDHIHILVEVSSVKALSNFLQSFKTHSSKKIQERTGKNGCPIWQRGTMDHCIRDDLDFDNHLSYLFYNSSKHLNISPNDYPYHNFKEIVKRKWLEGDFCSLIEMEDKEYEIYE